MFANALIVIHDGDDLVASVQLAAAITADTTKIAVVVLVAASGGDLVTAQHEIGERLQDAIGDEAPWSVVVLAEEDEDAITLVVQQTNPDTIVLGSRGLSSPVHEVLRKTERPILWAPGPSPHSLREILVPVVLGPASAVAAALLLRDRTTDEHHVRFARVGVAGGASAWDAEDIKKVLDWRSALTTERIELSFGRPFEDLRSYLADRKIDLVVLPSTMSVGLSGKLLRRSVQAATFEHPCAYLFVSASPPNLFDRGRLDAADIVMTQARRGFVQRADPLHVAHAAGVQKVGLFSDGRFLETVEVQDGWFEVPADLDVPIVALAPATAENTPSELDIETVVSLRNPPESLVALVDAAVPPEQLGPLIAQHEHLTWWAVRMDHDETFVAARERLRPVGIRTVLDAGVVLDDGHPDDLPDEARDVRIERVARRLGIDGVDVAAVVTEGRGTIALRERDACADTADDLERLTGAAPSSARSFILQVDNRDARRTLFELIDSATERIHIQAYEFEDDSIGREVAEHLRTAAGRGLEVRVLVDSLLSRHRSLSMVSPVLSSLEVVNGIDVRCVRPVEGVPSLEDLKRRDHKKLAIADGATALVAGRNIGHHYYRGFDEITLVPDTPAPDIPWLDTSVVVTGPVVQQAEAAFHSGWRNVGGDEFSIETPTPAGTIPARVITHAGLDDANTVEAYRWIFDRAEHHIYVLNTFPLQFELQHSLRRALARGVLVHYLVGNPRPYHGSHEMFPGWTVRDIATRIVLGRLDELQVDGARVREFGVLRHEGWDPSIPLVYPHVHAKLASSDGARLLAGSANLDITAGYWENEAVVLVEHAPTVARAEEAIEALFDHARPLSSSDESGRRAWLSRHWPSVLG